MKFRISIGGGLYLGLSALLLALGMYRMELFAIISGAVLLVCLLFALINLGLSLFLWRNETPLLLQKEKQFTVIPQNKKNTFPLTLPGVACFYELVYTTDRTQIRKEKIRIQLHGGEKTIQASDFLRGKYVCESSSLCFRDLFDFFCIELHTKKESVLRPLVFPAQTAESVQTPIPFIPALESDNKNSSLRTQDMYESRPYIPGDDLRKINWKVYAHTQELAVRQGDFTPPPIQSFFVFIEEPCGRQNKKVLSAIYDECIAKVCGFLLELQKHEPDIIFLFAAKRGAIQTAKLLHTDAESQNKIQSLLAIPQVQKTPHGIQIQNLLPVLAAESILLYFYLPLESNVHPLQTLSASPVNKKIVFYPVSIKPSKTLSLYEKLLYQNKFEKQRSTLSAKIASAAEIHLAEYERKNLYAYAI